VAGVGVVIVGGGIAGLSAAYDLAKAGTQYTLIEKLPRLGGVIQTKTCDGCVIEGGPDSFISQKPEALALIKELGLEQEVIGSNDATRVTYILRGGRLVRLPEGIRMIVPTRVWPLLQSPLLGWGTKLRMGLELFRKPVSNPDRSVADFVIDHFGRETLDYLAEPLLSGVYGGDPREMSVSSVLGAFAEMERKSGSLSRAVLKQSRAPKPPGSGTLFRTLKGGLGTLTAKLSEGLTVRHGVVEAIERIENRFRIRVSGEWADASNVILACPAWAAAGLASPVDSRLSQLLGEIPYTSSVTVAMGFDASKFDGRRAGHGFLIPRVERRRMAACTFIDAKFDFRAPANRVLLRCFFGGAGDDKVLDESDETLTGMAREELRTILGLTAAPLFTSISRCPRSMAQYTVGHAVRWKEIQARAAAIPGLYLAGNGYTGIGIPDCIRMGRAAAASLVASPVL
jgi:protoporphyrinogen/coproporphyrinogen III oxidase